MSKYYQQELEHHAKNRNSWRDRSGIYIELGIFKDSTREELLGIAKRMLDEDNIDSVVLGCTELPLILTENKYGIPFLNTTAIHCESIIKYCIQTK